MSPDKLKFAIRYMQHRHQRGNQQHWHLCIKASRFLTEAWQHRKTAAKALGVDVDTLKNWMKAGQMYAGLFRFFSGRDHNRTDRVKQVRRDLKYQHSHWRVMYELYTSLEFEPEDALDMLELAAKESWGYKRMANEVRKQFDPDFDEDAPLTTWWQEATNVQQSARRLLIFDDAPADLRHAATRFVDVWESHDRAMRPQKE